MRGISRVAFFLFVFSVLIGANHVLTVGQQTTCTFDLLESFNVGEPVQGLAWANGQLHGWSGIFGRGGELLTISPNTRSIINRQPEDSLPLSVFFDDKGLTSNGSDLILLSSVNGNLALTLFGPSRIEPKHVILEPNIDFGDFSVDDLAWDGSNYWLLGILTDRTLIKVSTSGEVVSQKVIPLGIDAESLTSDGSFLYGALGGRQAPIHKFSLETGEFIETCSTGISDLTGSIHGLAWDGSNLWASDTEGNIYKLGTGVTPPRPRPPGKDPCIRTNDPQIRNADWYWANLKDWGWEVIQVDKLHNKNLCGKDVVVAVIDRGFDVHHPAFNYVPNNGWVSGKVNVIAKCNTGGILNKGSCGDADIDDAPNGHGTQVTGIVWKVAPEAKFIIVKADCGGIILKGYCRTVSELLDGIDLIQEFSDDQGIQVDVIVASLASQIPDSPTDGGAQDAIKFSQQAVNSVVIAAAGNETFGYQYPAPPSTGENVLSISSLARSIGILFISKAYSPTNPNAELRKPDLAAPGELIKTLDPDEITEKVTGGSSYAGPYVAGIAALLMIPADKMPEAVRGALLHSALGIDGTNLDGCGSVRGYDALQRLEDFFRTGSWGRTCKWVSPTITPSPTMAAVASLVRGDPSDSENPELMVGLEELRRVLEAWTNESALPGVGLIDDVTMLEIAYYWLYDLPVNRKLPVDVREDARTLFGQSVGPIAIARKLSASVIRAGESFEVTITISAEQDVDSIRWFDLVPEGWQVEGDPFFSLDELSEGSQKQFVYHVTVPQSARGTYTLSGLARTRPGQVLSVAGDSKVTVIAESIKSTLASFDTNYNGLIDDPELFEAIDRWIAGEISDELFFDLIDAWIEGTQVRTAAEPQPSSLVKIKTLRTQDAITFAVQGQNIASMGVDVYDLSGRRVLSDQAATTQLTWNLSTNSHKLVANGVFLYVVTVKKENGQILRSKVKKFAVMR